MTIKDKDGQNFDGASTYRLHVPANAPVKQYWSATVYDRATHALIRDMAVVEPLVANARDCRRTPTVRWTSTSAQSSGGQGIELGADECRADSSKCSSASTARKSRCSTRRGSCRTSSGSLLTERRRSVR